MRLNSQFWFLGDVYDGLRLRIRTSILDVAREVNLALQNSGMNLGKQERSALVAATSCKYATP
ncbi:hypothetical protein [Nostoc sp.]|uniref:hypothetical protein n=1 Tax=Nostoc sp. TaxID=1180 RepID=UPI002FF45073